MKISQHGTTMIELLITMVLGLTLVAGISEIFLQSQKTFKAQRSLSYLMDDGGYITETLSKELRHVGFLRSSKAYNGTAHNIFRQDASVLGSSTQTAITLNRDEFVDGATGDSFAYRYQLNDISDDPLNATSACTQNLGLTAGEDPSTTVNVVTVYFYVANDATGIPTIYCTAKRETITAGIDAPTTTTSPPTLIACVLPAGCAATVPTALPLISNVERLIVLYGVDADGPDANGRRAPSYYADAATVTAAGGWTNVVSMRLYVVLRSDDDNVAKSTGTFSIDGVLCNGTGVMRCPAANNRIYRVFSTTVAFRNQL